MHASINDRFLSPFRYPGGKAFFAPILAELIACSNMASATYVEPFAGGAAAGLRLLADGVVAKLVLNDLDARIYAAWTAIVDETDRFLECLENSTPTMDDWYLYSDIVDRATEVTFELGFATFMLNRMNRSGIIRGSAPIGGYHQTGVWRLDARLYKSTLARRIAWIGSRRADITIVRKHAVDFLRSCSRTLDPDNTFYFIDPPYVEAGTRLYFNGMIEEDHRDLANTISESKLLHWIVTYDDSPTIESLYSSSPYGRISTNYSLNKRRRQNEIVIFPSIYQESMVRHLV